MITDDAELAMLAMAPVTVDRCLAPDRAKLLVRRWAGWDDAVPGLVEFDLVGHEGGEAVGEHCSWFPMSGLPRSPAGRE